MKDALILSVLSAVPRSLLSRVMGTFARVRLEQPLRRWLLRWYIGKYGVDLSECVDDLDSYPSLVAFFTRPLHPGARPIAGEVESIVSPADGFVYAVGEVRGGKLPQSPDLDYAVSDLLGGDRRYDDGSYVVIYLSPKDYHRVHNPREGRLAGWRYRPGDLWPVFPAATRKVRDLFAANERLIVRVLCDVGEVGVVMVGAFGVGRMTTTFCDLVTNTGADGGEVDAELPTPLTRGAELGRFEMGSTVVLLFEKGRIAWDVAQGATVKVGQRIAHKV